MISHRQSTLALATKIAHLDHGQLNVQQRPATKAA
jgi:hypothetical protein